MAITTARGVAKVIKRRVPACTGAHWPVQPHHFRHVQDAVAPPQPRQHLPVRQPQTCMPCNQTRQMVALGGRVTGDPEVPECALGARDARCAPESPNLGNGTNAGEALAGSHGSD